jgi:hypothetical protein
MLEHLEIGASANFFLCKKRLSDAAIRRLFVDLRRLSRNPKSNLFERVRDEVDGNVFSTICFSFEREPGFLDPAAGVFDRVHGFLLLVERGDYIALVKAGLELPARFKSDYLGRTSRSNVEQAIATAEAIFERVRVKSTSPSRQVLRAKTLEADNLENAMPMASAGRYVTQAYSVRRPDGHFQATPSTGRISQRGDRGDYEFAVTWAATVIDQLEADGDSVALFIRNFARQLDLQNLSPDTLPVLFAVDVPQLTELLLAEEPTMRLVQRDGQTSEPTQLTTAAVESVLEVLSEGFVVHRGRPDYRIKRGTRTVGTLRLGKTRFALRSLNLQALGGLEIESCRHPLGEDDDARSLTRYIDRENLFTILFTDPTLAYVGGELFRDEAMLNGGDSFLRHLLPVQALVEASSEKGAFAAEQTEFSPGCVFRIIVDDIAANDDVLVCDDLGDEWADFIGLNTQARPPSINFYHGKHGALTLGASSFHVSVSQAEKNLGRMTMHPRAMEAKYGGWATNYTGQNVQSAIARIVRGEEITDVKRLIDELREAPDVVKHVYIVTSSLSKAQVEAAFQSLAEGGRPSAHFVQLYWLLMAYYSACTEMGAVGFVVCRP